MRLWCYLCRRALKRTDVARAVEFTFGTFPLCAACIEEEGT